jgi:hypothetical protein
MDSMLAGEKPFSLLNIIRVEVAPVAVISLDVSTNSSDGATSDGYSLSSAF